MTQDWLFDFGNTRLKCAPLRADGTPGDVRALAPDAFDALPSEWVDEPFLTVAAQPAYDIGRRAADMMIERLVGERTTAGESVVLPFEVIVRRSTAAPPARDPPRRISPAGGNRPAAPRHPPQPRSCSRDRRRRHRAPGRCPSPRSAPGRARR
jgi:hypothetical protein